MLSKCYVSNRNVTKGWFLKLNKDPVLKTTICHFPKCEEITRGHLYNPHHIKLVTQNIKVFFLQLILNYFQLA